MLKFASISSGSGGNSFYLAAGNDKLLVDDGLPLANLQAGLSELGARVEELTAVLLTHEHSDHIAGIPALTKAVDIPIYAAPATIDAAPDTFRQADLRVFPIGDHFHLGGLDIMAFPTSHDAKSSVGFCFYHQGRKIGFATDLGVATDEVVGALSNCEALFLEANHSENLLAVGAYPPFLKRRIQGRYGHLSNRGSAALIKKIASGRAQQIMLGHLSAENNTPLLAFNTIAYLLKKSGVDSISLAVAPRSRPSVVISPA